MMQWHPSRRANPELWTRCFLQPYQRQMTTTVKGATAALRNLQLQQRKEHIVLMTSIGFFYTVVLYVVWTRIRIPFLLW